MDAVKHQRAEGDGSISTTTLLPEHRPEPRPRRFRGEQRSGPASPLSGNRAARVVDALALALGGLTTVVTALSLVRAKAWWIRIWDFPRVQVTVVGVAALVLGAAAGSWRERTRAALAAPVAVAVGYQLARVWHYTRLAPREVQRSRSGDPSRRISLVVANVLQTNRQAERVLDVVRSCDADIVLCIETDTWWQARLDALTVTHPHVVRCPLPNTYGMLLYLPTRPGGSGGELPRRA